MTEALAVVVCTIIAGILGLMIGAAIISDYRDNAMTRCAEKRISLIDCAALNGWDVQP